MVVSAPSALPKLAVTGVSLAPGAAGTVTATVTLTDSGTGAATGVHLTLARLGGVAASSLGGSVSLGAGQSQTVTVTFPANTPHGSADAAAQWRIHGRRQRQRGRFLRQSAGDGPLTRRKAPQQDASRQRNQL